MNSSRRVILVGGSGLVGRTLAHHLLAAGREVVVVSRNPPRPPPTPGVRHARWDGRTADGWGRFADGAEAVINLAGETIGGTKLAEVLFQRWTKTKKKRILDSRVAAGEAVLQAVRAARNRPSLLVQMSAVGFYGPSHHPGLDEDSPPGDDFLAEVCRAWEASTEDVEGLGVRRVVVRTGLVLSLRGGLFPIVMLPFRLFLGGRLGSGEQGFSWIHAEDQARAMLFLLDDERARGVFNLTAPEPVSNARLGRAVARVLHRPYWFPTPSFLLRLALGQKASLVVEGQFVRPAGLVARGFEFRFPTLDAALRDILSA